MNGIWVNFRRHLRKYILAGAFALLPIGISLFFFRFLLNITAGALAAEVSKYWPETPAALIWIASVAGFVCLTYGIGLVSTHFLGRRLIALGEKIIMLVPLLKTIYGTSKKVIDTFVAADKEAFRSVVLIPLPGRGIRTVGLVTGKINDEQGHLFYKVFVPTTPNPTSGFFLIVSADEIVHTTISVEDGIKMVFSGGIVSPAVLNHEWMAPDSPGSHPGEP